MMNQTFLSIKEPCHQGWETMSISEKGRFCSSCQKHVHDFSRSGIDEIKKVYSESEDGLCGHIPVRLLHEQFVEKEIHKGHNRYIRKFCLAAIFCFGANLFTIDAAKASTFYKIKATFFNLVACANDTIVVKGIVKDKDTREAMPFVTIFVLHKDSIVAKSLTNINGEYEIKVPKEYVSIDLKAVSIGYESHIIKNISISSEKKNKVDIDIKMEEYMLDGMMIMEVDPIISTEPLPSGKTIKKEEYKKMPK